MASSGSKSDQKGERVHPLPVFCFQVVIEFGKFQNATAMFRSAGGLKYETEVVDIKVGGRNDTTFKLPGSTKWSNIVLKRGFTADPELLAWREGWVRGAKGDRKRFNGKITQLDNALNAVCSWTFEKGWPCKWEVSEFDASKNEVAIETLEIAHHGLVFVPNGGGSK